MERGEPTFVPEWLKNSGSGSPTNQFSSSSLQSGEQAISKSPRHKSSANNIDNDLGRLSVSDRTTSSYLRRPSSSNGSAHPRSYSSFGRGNRDRNSDRDRDRYLDRDWIKDTQEFRDREKAVAGDHRHREYSDPSGNGLPSRFEKNGLRRSLSSLSETHDDSWSRRADTTNANKSNQSNGTVLNLGTSISTVHNASFERDFPSLGEEKQSGSEIGRIRSPGLSTAIQSLPIGNSVMVGGKSALAEVPVIVGSNGGSPLAIQPPVPSSSFPVTGSLTTGRNMAEAVAQGPPRTQASPQLSVETQRLEELAVKQFKQLIPLTPSKSLILNSSEKAKPKIAQHQNQSSHLVASHSPRGGTGRTDFSKASSVVKFQGLKPNKDSLSLTSGSKVPNGSLPISSVPGPAPMRNPGNTAVLPNAERKPIVAAFEKRPSPQAQSRNEFFNLVRKKSMTSSSAAVTDSVPSVSICVEDKTNEAEAPPASQGRDDQLPENSSSVEQTSEDKADFSCNGDACDEIGKSVNRNNHSSSDVLYHDEEEVAFLRSLGWDENAGEDEGLTEEEISAFYRNINKYQNSKPYLRNYQAMLPQFLSDAKLES